jgi:hypothetical protein
MTKDIRVCFTQVKVSMITQIHRCWLISFCFDERCEFIMVVKCVNNFYFQVPGISFLTILTEVCQFQFCL